MTMRRLSEIRQLKIEEQEQLNRLAGDTDNENDHEGKMGLAVKTLNKFVDVVRVATCDDGEGVKKAWNKSIFNDSFGSASSDERAPEKLLAFANSFRRRSSASGPRRRTSQESTGPADFNASNGSLLRGEENLTRARTANEMYAIAANEQGANMAPRKSVGDFTAMLSVGDISEGTRDSLRSDDLSGLYLEEIAKSARSAGVTSFDPGNEDGCNDGSLRDEDRGNDVLATFTVCVSESTGRCTAVAANAEHENDEMDAHEWLESQLQKRAAGRIATYLEKTKEDNLDLNQSRHSDTKSAISGLSVMSDCTSACGDGLIVGFRPRHCSDEDEDHMNSGNFASDFSAWERKSDT